MSKNLLEVLRCENMQPGPESQVFVLQIKELFYLMEKYFIIFDLDNGTIHSKIFNDLYLTPHVGSYAEISFKNNVHERTLNRYVIRYNVLAKRLISKRFPMLKEKYRKFFV